MPYARHTMTTIDPFNYDAMMSIANSDDFGDFSQWPGLVPVSYTHLTLPTNREV